MDLKRRKNKNVKSFKYVSLTDTMLRKGMKEKTSLATGGIGNGLSDKIY